MEEKINLAAVTQYTVKADNSADTGRAFDIKAALRVNGGRLTGIDGGEVRDNDTEGSQANPSALASFHLNGGTLNIQFMTDSGRSAITEAVEAFIANASEAVKTAEIKL